MPRSGGASSAIVVGGEHRLGGRCRRRLVPRVHLGEVVAREHRVAALREAEDADGVVDRVGLRPPAGAELERGDAHRERADAGHDAVARRRHGAPHGRVAASARGSGSPPCARIQRS